MRLSVLLEGVPFVSRPPLASDPEIALVTHDSRRCREGALFAALPGLAQDGREFAVDAVRRGASAVLGRSPAPSALLSTGVPYVVSEDPRRAAGLLSACLAGHPAERLLMVGVTGTSGKTTTTFLLDHLLEAAHPIRGLFGTLVYRSAKGEGQAASRTTPEATDLQPMLRELVDAGGTAAILECSSHALCLQRLAGCFFDAAVFLNLSHDHLDYHLTMESYFEAKASLFSMRKPAGTAIVNVGDPFGQRLAARLFAERVEGDVRRLVTFRLAGAEESEGARIAGGARIIGNATHRADGTTLRVHDRETGARLWIDSSLAGRPNAENLLAAAATGLALGLSPDVVAARLSEVRAVPGRLERIPNELGLEVFVDYAHKPAALQGVLATARTVAEAPREDAPRPGRVLVVFGCGGERDRAKRPEMGRIAATMADEVFVTSDNSRFEDPHAILAEIRAGIDALTTRAPVSYEVDRRVAIRAALSKAGKGDVVVLAGKGHESYQEAMGQRTPFDDRAVAREILGEIGSLRGLGRVEA